MERSCRVSLVEMAGLIHSQRIQVFAQQLRFTHDAETV